MGNPRNWTRDFNAPNRELQEFVKQRAGKSQVKRREARERAAVRLAVSPTGGDAR